MSYLHADAMYYSIPDPFQAKDDSTIIIQSDPDGRVAFVL